MPTASSGFGSTRIPPRLRSRPISTRAASSSSGPSIERDVVEREVRVARQPVRAGRRGPTGAGERWSPRAPAIRGAPSHTAGPSACAATAAVELGVQARVDRVEARRGHEPAQRRIGAGACSGRRAPPRASARPPADLARRSRAGTPCRARSGDRSSSRQPLTERSTRMASRWRQPNFRRTGAPTFTRAAAALLGSAVERVQHERAQRGGVDRPPHHQRGAGAAQRAAQRARVVREDRDLGRAATRSAGAGGRGSASRTRSRGPSGSARSSALSAPSRSTNGTFSDTSSARTSASSPSWISRERGVAAGAWLHPVRRAAGLPSPSAGAGCPCRQQRAAEGRSPSASDQRVRRPGRER